MTKPLVSVVCPAYEAAQTIGGMITSIENQTLKDWELIIVDDGSHDTLRTEAIIGRFRDKRIRFIRSDHVGIAKARMKGYKAARADILVIQDADDLSLPERLEFIVNAFNANKNIDVLAHSLYISRWIPDLNCIDRQYVKAEPIKKDDILKEQKINGVVAFRKSVIKKCPLRDETTHAYDWMMHIDFLFNNFRYAFIDRPLYEYVRHKNSASERYERGGERHEALVEIARIVQACYKKTFKPKDWEL